jgi:alpha-L-arabinofuranosidase
MSALHQKLPLLCLALSPAFALAQTATVTVNAATTLHTVDDRHFGANSTAWDPNLGTAQTQSLLQAAGIRAVRLPGGSLSDEYHWRTNTNLDHDTIAGRWTWSAGFDKSSQLVTGLSAKAMITVNYGTGTPQEAAAWVAYANFPGSGGGNVTLGMDNPASGTTALPTPGPYDWKTAQTWADLRAATPLTTDDGMNFLRLGRSAPFGFKYWEIGNENYGDWESDLQSPKQDPVTYATRAANYMQLMKAVDPTIRIGVVVETGNQYNNWTASVLGTLAGLGAAARPDFVIYHRYDGAPGQENDATLLQKAASWPSDASDLRTQITTAFGHTLGDGIEIIVTENNSVYSNTGKQTTSLVNGLYLADSVSNVMQTEIRGLFWWDIRNGTDFANNLSTSLYGWRLWGDYGILSSQATNGPATNYETYPTYYAFKLLSYFVRGGDSIVSASSSNTLLDVFAAHRADGSYALLVLNKDPVNDINGSFTLNGVNITSAKLYAYGKDNDNAAKTNAPGCSDITASTAAYTGGSFTQSFPSYSMTVVSLNGPDYPVPATSPVIVTQPVSASLTAGGSTTFTSDASGCPVATVKWQRAPSGSSTFADLTDGGAYSGSSTRTLTVSSTTTAMSGDQFRMVATTTAGSANSSSVTLTVAAASGGGSSGGGNSGGGGGGGGGDFDLLTLAALLGAVRFALLRRAAPASAARPAI